MPLAGSYPGDSLAGYAGTINATDAFGKTDSNSKISTTTERIAVDLDGLEHTITNILSIAEMLAGSRKPDDGGTVSEVCNGTINGIHLRIRSLRETAEIVESRLREI